VNAFLPYKNVTTLSGEPATAHHHHHILRPGQAVFFTVASWKQTASALVLAYDARPCAEHAAAPATAGKLHNITSLKPGMVVNGSVGKVTSNCLASGVGR
jgi:hypothetical protein